MRHRLLLFAFLVASVVPLAAQLRPISGQPLDIVYRSYEGGALAAAESLQVVYAFNFWGTRYGTRLALWENVLRPDSAQEHRATMTRANDSWKTSIDIPSNAAVLSYYFTDGKHRLDNGEKTFACYVFGSDGNPVKNAHFYMTNFLQLARADLDTRLREAEAEVVAWPENFRAYTLYFTLLFERDKGREKSRSQIYGILSELDKKYSDNDEFLNLVARTLYYILRDTHQAVEVRKKINVTKLWPEVVLIFDRDRVEEDKRRVTLEREQTRAALINAPLPVVFYYDTASVKQPVWTRAGGPVLVVFWASTSAQSIAALKQLAALRDRYRSKQVTLLAINLDTDEAMARAKMQDLSLTLTHGFRVGTMLADLGVDGIPTVHAIDGQGVVRKVAAGLSESDLRDIEAFLQSLR